MSSIVGQFWHLANQTYWLVAVQYPEAVRQGVRPPLVTDVGRAWRLLVRINAPIWSLILWLAIGVMAVTAIRYLVTHRLMALMIDTGLVRVADRRKFTESLWSTLFYLSTFALSATVIWRTGCLADPRRLFADYQVDARVPWPVSQLYFWEISYYLHSAYAVFYINEWKTDSWLMFGHHVVAGLLIGFSYLVRTYLVGTLVMFLHDVCDVALEGSKCLVKVQLRAIQTRQSCLRTSGFALFIGCWFLFRLYCFPVAVLRASAQFNMDHIGSEHFIISFGLFLLLWLIYLMDLYWATLIVQLVWKVSCTDAKPEDIDDVRELDNAKQE